MFASDVWLNLFKFRDIQQFFKSFKFGFFASIVFWGLKNAIAM